MATMFAIRCSASVSWTRFLFLAFLCSLLIGSSLARPASDDDDNDNSNGDDTNSDSDYDDEPATTKPPTFRHHHHAHVHPKKPPTSKKFAPREFRRHNKGRWRASEIDDHGPSSTTKEPMAEAISSPPPSVDESSAEPESRAGKISTLEYNIPSKVQKLLVPLGSNDDDAKDSNDDYNDYDYAEPAPKLGNSSQIKPAPRGSDVDDHANTTTVVLRSTTEAPAVSASDPTTTGQPK